MANPRVFLEVTIASHKVGRVVLELHKDIAPKTVENFRCLCTGEKGTGKRGKPLHYKNNSFHRVVPGFVAQAGDIIEGNGTSGECIYGLKFPDENFSQKHNKPGLLSMANVGANSNCSQFFITLGPAPWLDGKHVIFGHVADGMNVLRAIEEAGSREHQSIVSPPTLRFPANTAPVERFHRENVSRKARTEE